MGSKVLHIILYSQHTVWTVTREEAKKGFLFLAPRSYTNGANILDGQGFDKIIKNNRNFRANHVIYSFI